jgi:signal peptidase I
MRSTKKTASEITLDWIKTILIAIVIAVLIRGSVGEIMAVPTPSMVPTIKPRDIFVVDKLEYRFFRQPDYGDVIVFWSPFTDEQAEKMLTPIDRIFIPFTSDRFRNKVRFVKRLVAKPGDTVMIGYDNRLYVNGKVILKDVKYMDHFKIQTKILKYGIEGEFADSDFWKKAFEAYKMTPKQKQDLLQEARALYPMIKVDQKIYAKFMNLNVLYGFANGNYVYDKEYVKNLEALLDKMIISKTEPIKIKIPKGYYLAFGDNTAESLDCRYFSLVPKSFILGRVVLNLLPIDRFGLR